MNDPDDEATPIVGEDQIRALVAVGEEISDPIEGLVGRAKADAGAPFEPEVVAALSEVRRSDLPRFQRIRAELKRAGIRVADLDDALAAPRSDLASGGAFGAGGELASILDELDFFCSPHRTPHVDIVVGDHRESMPVDSTTFSDFLTSKYYKVFREPPAPDELRSAISLARSRAKFEGPQRNVNVRVAELEGRLYVDLGDPEWRAVEISSAGWAIVADPPVRFVRPPGLLPLPEPQRGGSVALLRPYLNLHDDLDFVLVVGFLLATLRPSGPYPLLALTGEQGTAKSTTARLIKLLTDPSSVPLRSPPRSAKDLFIAATNGHLIAFDNLTRVSGELSDALCMLSTGGGFASRRLYSDGDEALFDACRPALLTGIDIVTRSDLADRTVFIELKQIPEAHRKLDSDLRERFDGDRPLILGALLDALVHGLREIGNVKLERLPRMADFVTFAVACEGAFATPGTFMKAYEDNRRAGTERMIEHDVVASAIVRMMEGSVTWRGTASRLLKELSRGENDPTRRSRVWPQSPSQLSKRLILLRAPLRDFGIDIERIREGHDRQRNIVLRRNVDPKDDDPAS